MINKLYTKYACTWQTQGTIFTLKYDDEEHMQELEKIIKENIGVLDYKTNVLAKMTDYSFFVEHPSFKKLGQWFYGKVYEHQLVDKQYLQEDRFHAQIRDAWGSVFNKDEDTMLAQLADGEFVSRADAVLGAGIMQGADPNDFKQMRRMGAKYFYTQQDQLKRIYDMVT